MADMSFDEKIQYNIQQALIKLRKANSLTMKQVSDAIGVKDSTYRSWETGRSCPKKSTIVLISKIYNVSCDYILNGAETEKFSVASGSKYNDEIYGDSYLSQLSPYEKSLLMKVRILNLEDKQKVIDLIDKIINNVTKSSSDR